MTRLEPHGWALAAVDLAVSVLPHGPVRDRYRAELTAFPHTPVWCRVRLHHRWRALRTPDGHRYRRCSACGTDDDGTRQSRNATGDAIATANAVHWY